MHYVAVFITVIGLTGLCACTISDEDRCPDGFEFEKDGEYCIKIDDSASAGTNGLPNDNSMDATTSDGSSETDTGLGIDFTDSDSAQFHSTEENG